MAAMSRLIITAMLGSPWLRLSVLVRLIIQATTARQSHVTSDNMSHGWLVRAMIIGHTTSDNNSHGEPTAAAQLPYPTHLT